MDLLREILEECIALDVVGAAVIDRLSLQAAPLEVSKEAARLGVTRFAGIHTAHLAEPSRLDTVLRTVDRDGSQRTYHCLTSRLLQLASSCSPV